MKLPRLGDKTEDRLLEEAATLSLCSGEKIIQLDKLAYAKKIDLKSAALSFQERGFGRLIEIGAEGEWVYHFSLNGRAFDHADNIRQAIKARSFRGRIAALNLNALNAISALVAALSALTAAYFSYLSFVSDHAQTH